MMNAGVFIGTANRGFAQQAQEELRRLLGSVKSEWIVPGEVFLFAAETDREEAIRRITGNEPVFLRHMQPVDARTSWNGSMDSLMGFVVERLSASPPYTGSKIAVQVRKTEDAAPDISSSVVKTAVDERLSSDYTAEPVVKGADFILSLFLTKDTVYYGMSRPEENLSDWSGGAVRFRREDGQVSRAKFKLLEAEQAFGLDFTQYRFALDIGAAPGGWTSLLLERGLKVTAVDPAKLDAGLLSHPNLTYHAKKADEVVFAADAFDLLVCDMSWSHRQMAKLVRGLLYALKTGGTAIITVKLMNKKAFQSIREVIQDLSPELELQKAKQLFHNREELTLFLVKTR
ncbi:SAM-dependent methyltransferase [Paenibacillus naphthalenovorans]|uniref:SAM-dependent methyltransferase n=1 Tax=Paenibacillus naphthalenovorans TaxID=162209 RepID=UPI0010B2EC26|nr:SAM-dependent methyltransferase [Paenibacillus naphthalenovorans]GCL70258.1 SAM-dependent methyltransferase [Paenibacillus naphthalenovorans]